MNTNFSIKAKSAWLPANSSRLKFSSQYAVDGAPSLVVLLPKYLNVYLAAAGSSTAGGLGNNDDAFDDDALSLLRDCLLPFILMTWLRNEVKGCY